jgi:hypothetical protein
MNELTNLKQFPLLISVVIEILIIFVLAFLVNFIKNKLLSTTRKSLANADNIWHDAVLSALVTPTSAFIWLLFVSYSFKIINELMTNQTILSDISIYLKKFGGIIIFTWFIIKLINGLEKNYFRRFDYDTTLDLI